MLRWSGGLVVRAVKVFMMARVVQVVPMVQVIRLGRLAQVVRWSGGHLVIWSFGQVVRWSVVSGQVVRVVSLDDMLSALNHEIIEKS